MPVPAAASSATVDVANAVLRQPESERRLGPRAAPNALQRFGAPRRRLHRNRRLCCARRSRLCSPSAAGWARHNSYAGEVERSRHPTFESDRSVLACQVIRGRVAMAQRRQSRQRPGRCTSVLNRTARACSNCPCTPNHILLTAFLCCVRCTGFEAARRSALLVDGALTTGCMRCAAMPRPQRGRTPKPVRFRCVAYKPQPKPTRPPRGWVQGQGDAPVRT